MTRVPGLFILASGNHDKIYGEELTAEIAEMVDIYAPPQTGESVAENPAVLQEAEVVFSGWGAPRMDAEFLAHTPRLRAVFYGAGSVRRMVTEALWERGIVVTSSWGANAVPVAEFTLAQILLSLKLTWRHARDNRSRSTRRKYSVPGAYGSTVALISLGMIGRLVCGLLKPFDLNVIAYDPFVAAEDAAALGVTLCGLDECFRAAHVVSLHTPWLPQTEKMIRGQHFAMMRPDATFINTARGAIVDEPAMIEVLSERQDLTALLDVTYPEPPAEESPLYSLPNVVLTPHIAGSMDLECRRMGRYAVDECRRFLAGEPLKWQVTRERAATMA